MPDDPKDKKQTRDKGLLETLRDFNKLRAQAADIGNAFFEKSTEHNGPSDAMRHIIFNAKLTAGTGSSIIPWILDKLHEYGESAIPIPGIRQPNREMNMDLINGAIGREIGKLNLTDAEMVDRAQQAVQSGKAKTLIDDDQSRNYAKGGTVIVDEDGKPISTPLEEEVQQQFGMEPNLDRLTMIPYKDPKKGWIAPNIVYDLAKLVASPIAALHGKYISPEEGVEGALTLGSPTTAIGLVSKAEPATARMFIGPMSKKWDPKSHALALKMEDEGASPRTIWEQTMNWRTPQGSWAQEISDKDIEYDPAAMLTNAKAKYKQKVGEFENRRKTFEDAWNIKNLYDNLVKNTPHDHFYVQDENGKTLYSVTGQPVQKEGVADQLYDLRQDLKKQAISDYATKTGQPVSERVEDLFRNTPVWRLMVEAQRKPSAEGLIRPSATTVRDLPMKDAIIADELFANYPRLAGYSFNVHTPRQMGIADASFNPYSGDIKLSSGSLTPESSLLHELQHGVQHIEGWEGGTSPAAFTTNDPRIAKQLYLRNLGETMARATEARQNLSIPQRNALFPEDSFTLPMVQPSKVMEQMMWQGMPAEKKALIRKYVGENISELSGAHRRNRPFESSSVPLAYDPEKVQSLADALKDEIQGPVKKFKEGGKVTKDKEPTIGQTIENLSYGLGEGFGHQMEGLGNLIMHPIESGTNIVKGVKAMIEDPSLIKQAAMDIAERATSSPEGLGEVIGENVSPTGVVKRLAAIGKPKVLGIIKDKGGNWITGNTALSYSPEGYTAGLRDMAQADELNKWLDTKLVKYIKNEMGTADDPVRKLFDQGIKHAEIRNPYQPQTVMQARMDVGKPVKGLAETPMGSSWEDMADMMILTKPAFRYLPTAPFSNNKTVFEKNPWLDKVPLETPVHTVSDRLVADDRLGFMHLTDELYNATREGSDLPEHLRLDPKKLDKVTVPQAVQLVSKINKWREENAGAINAARANNPATILHKDYPEAGFKWVQLRTPPDPKVRLENPKALEDALNYEGSTMGHCGSTYCRAVEAGDSQIFSLRDQKGEPHVTIEVRPETMTPEEYYDSGMMSDELERKLNDKYLVQRGQTWNDIIEESPEYQEANATIPPKIVQIKGKGNKMPADKYIPFVQDFVRSRDWSKVNELENAHLTTLEHDDYDDLGMSKMQLQQRMEEAGHVPDQEYFTEQELRDLMTKFGVEQKFATGGLVAPTAQMSYDPTRVQSIADQLRQDMYNG